MIRRNKIVLSLISLLLGVGLISLTIGRELFLQQKPTLFSFGVVHFAGYLFFLLMPVETLVPLYQSFGYPALTLLLIAIGTAILAQPINYAVGYLMSADVIQGLIGDKRYKRSKKNISEFGPVTIFLFNFLPLSSSVLSLVAGMLRYRFRNLIFFSLCGISLKYLVLVYLLGRYFV
jgi:membrane protein YqaA with SNARE-associated domain